MSDRHDREAAHLVEANAQRYPDLLTEQLASAMRDASEAQRSWAQMKLVAIVAMRLASRADVKPKGDEVHLAEIAKAWASGHPVTHGGNGWLDPQMVLADLERSPEDPELTGATVRHVEQRHRPDVLTLHTDRGAFCITAWAWSDALAEQDEDGLEVGLSIKHVPHLASPAERHRTQADGTPSPSRDGGPAGGAGPPSTTSNEQAPATRRTSRGRHRRDRSDVR